MTQTTKITKQQLLDAIVPFLPIEKRALRQFTVRVKSDTDSDIQPRIAALESPLVRTVVGIDSDTVEAILADGVSADEFARLCDADDDVISYRSEMIDGTWGMPEFETARELTEEAGISWEFEGWARTAESIKNHGMLGGVVLA